MPHPLDPRDYRLVPAFRYINGKLQKLPKNKWTLIAVLAILVFLDHSLISPIAIGAVIVLVRWLIRLVIYWTGGSR